MVVRIVELHGDIPGLVVIEHPQGDPAHLVVLAAIKSLDIPHDRLAAHDGLALEVAANHAQEGYGGALQPKGLGFAWHRQPLGQITSYDEALRHVHAFKHYVEDQDGHRLLNRAGQEKPFSRESDVQLFFGLVFFGSEFDINREPNNGRGPVDFKVSKGAVDKTLIEFKLGSNSQLKRNLAKQVDIYERANGTRSSVKVIVCYSENEQNKVRSILTELGLVGEESIVLIDARADNKPSASKA